MIFPHLSFEEVVQIKDRFRFDASKSFTNNGIITDVEIRPDAGDDFYSVMNSDNDNWTLDWAYASAGTKAATIRVITDVPAISEVTYSIEVKTEAEDNLFSNDNDLFPFEPNIYNFLPQGKSSFKYAHRASQEKILAYLDEQLIYKNDGSRYTSSDIVEVEGFNRWSIFQTLLIIFGSNQLANDDFFTTKRNLYNDDLIKARNRASLRLDSDGDGVIDSHERYTLRTARLVRR